MLRTIFGGDVPAYALLLISFVLLITSALSYYFVRARIFSFTLFLFYICNSILSFSLLHNNSIIFFYIIVTILVAFPIICLLIFAIDMRYALFCTDMSFALVIVWLLIPVFFVVNLIIYIFQIIHA